MPLLTLMLLMRANNQTVSYFLKVCFLSVHLMQHSFEVSIFVPLHSFTIKSTSYLFTDQQVWAFSGYDLVSGYPKPISSFGLPKKVKKVDAALYDEQSGKTLFFVGSEYYRCVPLRPEKIRQLIFIQQLTSCITNVR